MNAESIPTVAVPVSYLAALLAGHTGIPTKAGVLWERDGKKASLSLLAALYRAQWAVEAAGLGPFVVTSVFDSDAHLTTSFHYKGRAADIRTYEENDSPDGTAFASPSARRMWAVIAEALGPGFDVIIEKDHIHVEHDPRTENSRSAYMGERHV